MTKADLAGLEREVGRARERFADSLARVRSPAAFEEFKEDLFSQARETKDELIDRSREAAQDMASRFLTELKQRAVANPAAALAIGAGLLWRLVHRPPIAALLVGVGAISLLKTTPAQSSPDGYGAATSRYLPEKETVQEAAELAKETMQEWGEGARAVTQETVSHISRTANHVVDRASDFARGIVGDTAVRDRYLLGTAALAIGSAMVIAFQRRGSAKSL